MIQQLFSPGLYIIQIIRLGLLFVLHIIEQPKTNTGSCLVPDDDGDDNA